MPEKCGVVNISVGVNIGRRCFVLLGVVGVVFIAFSKSAAAQKLRDLRGVSRASFNHDASRVIVRADEAAVTIWALPAGTPVSGDLDSNASNGFLMSADSKMVLVGSKDGHSRVLDAITAKNISPPLDLPLNADFQMPGLFSPDGNTLLLFADKEAAAFDVRTGKRLATISLSAGLNEEETGFAAFTKDGAQCFMMAGSGAVTRYSTKDWKTMGKPMRHPRAESAYEFAFNISDDGQWLATHDSPGENGPKGNLQVWDVETARPVGKPIVAINGLAGRFMGNNRILILPGRGEASVREVPSMKSVYTLRAHDDVEGPNAELSPDCKWLLAWGADRKLALYDASSGKLASNYPGPAVISKVIMAPDSSGCYVVFDNTAFLLQNHHDNYVAKLTFPDLKVTEVLRITEFLLSATLSPDGKRLMLQQGGTDQERLAFFDAATLKPVE